MEGDLGFALMMRRAFLGQCITLAAAPAIVKASSLLQSSSSIPRVVPYEGSIIWASEIRETTTIDLNTTTYTYDMDCAVLVGEPGIIPSIRRVLHDGEIIYDADDHAVPRRANIVFYNGDQKEPDPTVRADLGDAPIMFGISYVVLSNLELTKGSLGHFCFVNRHGNEASKASLP